VIDREATELFPDKVTSQVTVRLKGGGTRSQRILDVSGSPGKGLSPRELRRKFDECLISGDPNLDPNRAWALLDSIRQDHENANLAEVVSLVATPG
jgi:hypothetical protein